MRNHSYDLHQPTDSFHDNQTAHFLYERFHTKTRFETEAQGYIHP